MKSIAEVSEALRARQKALQLTQERLRQAAGVSRQTMTHVLGGQQDFKLSTLLSVADRLGLEMVLLPREAAAGLRASADEPVVMTAVDEALARLRKAAP